MRLPIILGTLDPMPMTLRLLPRLLIAFSLCAGLAAESVEDRIKATDMQDPEAVFALAQWCAENAQPSRARRYYNAVVKLEPDHYGARDALGQVKVNERWVSARMVEGGAVAGEPGTSGSTRKASGPGPAAADIGWDLTLPRDPMPESIWINQYVDRLNTVANDSREMDISIATMMAPEHFPLAVPRLCQAMLRPDWQDVYGGSMLVMEIMRKGDNKTAKSLLPFLVQASTRTTNGEDLYTFGYVVGMLRDKRVVPRLIELLKDTTPKIQDGAREGLAQITLLPLEQITAESATRWWDLNHALSDQDIFKVQLRDKDDMIALGAAKTLYDFRDHDIVPVLGRLLLSPDRRVRTEAIDLIKRISGSDWSYVVEGDADNWKKRSGEFLAWWKENEFRHTWIEDQGTGTDEAAPQQDPAVELVRKLASPTGNEAAAAEAALIAAGDAALPAVLEGLSSGNRIQRRRAYAALTGITRHNLPYDPSADDATVAAQIEAWEQWLIEQGRLTDPQAEEDIPDQP